MARKPAKKKSMGRVQMKRTRGGSKFDALLDVPGIKGETELQPGTPSNTLERRNWKL